MSTIWQTESPIQDKPEFHPVTMNVKVTAIELGFTNIIRLMVKISIATIPVVCIMAFIVAIILGAFSEVFTR